MDTQGSSQAIEKDAGLFWHHDFYKSPFVNINLINYIIFKILND